VLVAYVRHAPFPCVRTKQAWIRLELSSSNVSNRCLVSLSLLSLKFLLLLCYSLHRVFEEVTSFSCYSFHPFCLLRFTFLTLSVVHLSCSLSSRCTWDVMHMRCFPWSHAE
jgi:hypothetical protein